MKNIKWDEIIDGGKIPRKIKKMVFGKTMSKKKLNALLNIVVIGEPRKTMFDEVIIYPYPFCPHCGYPGTPLSLGNRASFPEHWELFICLKCKSTIGYIDNSPFVHALECKENNYDPTF